MCRNITILRGLEPPATSSEIEDAARQFVRKVGALTPAQLARPDVQRAIGLIVSATRELLVELPMRRAVAPGPPSRQRRGPIDEERSLMGN